MNEISRPPNSPPRDLQVSGTALWRNIMRNYCLDAAEVVLLHQLCRAVDVLDRISADLTEMGVTTMGSQNQPVANPLLNEQREQVKIVDRLQQALALPLTGEMAGVRRSASRKAAIRADTLGRKSKGRAESLRRAYGNGETA